MEKIIRVKNLTKDFKELRAVDSLSFEVTKGQVYGFLGQNGAGKSTTIRMLLSLIKPTAGSIEIFGLNLFQNRKAILRQVGAIIEKPDLYKYLSVLENLKIFAAMSGKRISTPKLLEQLAVVGLADRAHSKVKTCSQGMKQRLGIATALVHNPQLILLDEPTNGLDPQGIVDIRKLIIRLSKELQKTVLISSHQLNEVELIADAMIIIDKGKKVMEGKVSELFDPAETVVELKTTDDALMIEKIKQAGWQNIIQEKRSDCILLKLHKKDIPSILQKLVKLDIPILSFYSRH
ncbi:MAG: ABC transporter ATP-binding protein, partial [Chitinophagaceae bacterium]|nr:ABC transporter ATP-binding protein [Chitinophagaceae bacterium]